MMSQARRIVRELFALFMAEPDTLPPPWGQRAKDPRLICTAAPASSAITSPA